MSEQPRDIARAVQDISEKAQLLVREEVALAKAEITEKGMKLARGAVMGIVAGIFAVFALIYGFAALAWGISDLADLGPWFGFLVVFLLLILAGAILGLLASRLIKRGAPPTPQMAIEEAQLIRQTLTAPHPGTPQGTPSPSSVASEVRR